MKFNNYLSQLIENKSDLKNKEEICLYGCSSIIKDLYLDIKKTKDKKSINFIRENLNIPYQTLYCWVIGSNPIPISKLYSIVDLWRKVCDKNETEFSFKINELYSSVDGYSQNGQRKVILPRELNDNLGYLIGYFQGDGHLASTKIRGFRQYSLHFYDANKNMLLKINELMQKEFSINGNFYFNSDKKGSWCTLRITSKPVYLFFERILGLKSGRKTLNVDVPNIIKTAGDSIQCAFIRGFFDAEGTVGESVKNPWLEIGQASRIYPSEVLTWIHDKLLDKEIIFTQPQKVSNQEFFRLRVGRRETIKRFYNLIGSSHPKKISRFKEIIKKC